MVWGLIPAESLPGEQKYFIFTKGTYKVGRKGCDVIINSDKGVSRLHAELIVDAMTSFGPLQKISAGCPSQVCIRDCSKYGTFINKKLGSNAKVHEQPNKETTLKDGDLVIFGTGNATYRFSYVRLIFFIYCSKTFQVNHSFEDKISSIGACATHSWSPECTHVLVDESSQVKEDLIDAVVARKPVILSDWVEFIAEKSICTEIPTCIPYAPTLSLEGVSVKVVDPKVRQNCLAGYTFILGSLCMYKYGDRLQSLLDVGGAKSLFVNEFCSSSQASEDGGNNQVVLVIPEGSVNEFDRFHQVRSLSRVIDRNLVSAVLSGHLDPSIVVPPSIISSSCSTDETIVADSEVEMDTAASDCVAETVQSEAAIKPEDEEERSEDKHNKSEVKGEILGRHAGAESECIPIPSFNYEDKGVITRRDKVDESETFGNQHSDIIYSQDLIVKDTQMAASIYSITNNRVVNFKRFRKRETRSGNSFNDLIPFSKYPYEESDYGGEDVVEFVKEEKKRKQMEAIAEDLFNNEKVKKRGTAGSLRGFLTRC
ncbi:nijmegen breakage syndrome 1 protein isoform X2 [Macadamia integrifolia]|uniref:nijmegen breakage syndrome 1 protein isoform X2 n=1 Tax=Macadamia integrifolia TaxID=60698 RepID=UPI001C4E5D51|nr:nijmegen breakage syndrome 1 protein isoform X2 [Macadamia integrifolia]